LDNGKQVKVYFYRDKNKKEIYLIIEQNNTLYPIEIKRTANPTDSDVKNFNTLKFFKKDVGIGAIVCLVDSPVLVTENILDIPLTYL
jgi:predicted AAA+ superfamily ATPase